MNSENIVLKRLVLVSAARKYEVRFRPGVNVISGPIFTGKSAILKLIDYAFGARNAPSFPEIRICSELLLEATIAGEPLTIRRSLKSEGASTTYYDDDIETVFKHNLKGTEISSKHLQGQESVSSLVLRKLGLSDINISLSPTKAASDAHTFSFRDLLKLLYVNQTRMSSENAFFESDFIRTIKFKEAFSVVWGLHDDRRTQISKALKAVSQEIIRLESALESTREFLDRFGVLSLDELEKQAAALEKEEMEISADIKKLRAQTTSALGKNSRLIDRRNTLVGDREAIRAKRAEIDRALKNLELLRVQYERELKQLQFLKESDGILSSLPVVACPVCFQKIEHPSGNNTCNLCSKSVPAVEKAEYLDSRYQSVKRRANDLSKYVRDIGDENSRLERSEEEISAVIVGLDLEIKRISDSYVLPETQAAAGLEKLLALNSEKRNSTAESIRLRKKAHGEDSKLPILYERKRTLENELVALPAKVLTRDEVIADLSAKLESNLKAFGFREYRGAKVDADSLILMVRGQSYAHLSSAGAIGLAQAAYYLAFLQRALETDSGFPRFLMLDSPIINLGRDTADPEFRDQDTVNRFYKYLRNLHLARGNDFQLIIVDNRAPADFKDLVSVEFSQNMNVGRYGLIDDAFGSPPPQ